MLPMHDDCNYQEAFCLGSEVVTISPDGRFKIPASMLQELFRQKQEVLWLSRDPTEPQILMYPDVFKKICIKEILSHCSEKHDKIKFHKKYISDTLRKPLKKNGKISLQKFKQLLRVPDTIAVNKTRPLQPGDQIHINGMGFWYEISA